MGMDAPTLSRLEEVRILLEGDQQVLMKKVLGLDTKHIEGMVKGISNLQIGKLKNATQSKTGAKLSYSIKFENRDKQPRYGALKVYFHVSQEDGIELTWKVEDRGEWKEEASLKKTLKAKGWSGGFKSTGLKGKSK
jgi:hypothetical protein